MTRAFHSSPAVRANVPLLIALIGPSGSGKTFSAHRLAKGIATVQPGPVYGIDTEHGRMLELADRFSFTHMPFDPPFGSLDYLDAMRQAAKEGARTIIVDSMSHEHEGEGGMLELASTIVEEKIARKVKFKDLPSADCYEADKAREKLKLGGFIIPKAYRSKLINGMIQLPCNLILCFRAKEKVEVSGDGKPTKLGWMPIAGDEFWYEMTCRAMLPYGANGVPEWDFNKLEKGERSAVRVPEQFRAFIKPGQQLDEELGARMAEWASGGAALDVSAAVARIAASANKETLRQTAAMLRARPWGEGDRNQIAQAIAARQTELKTKE